ncbi:MAG: hypothetical protein Q8L78_02550 [Coxiellaceae bacterium]|nr:hypothetical protein [Coxiellaceae bacterium]
MRFTCLDLLPQTSSTTIRDSKMRMSLLNLLSFILENLIEAQQLFFQKNAYYLFDPHVGENGCQSRALHLLLSAHKPKKNDTELKSKLSNLKNYVSHFQERILFFQTGLVLNHETSLIEFLKKNGLLFLLEVDQKYIFICYFLTKYKNIVSDQQSIIDIRRIASDGKISQKLAKKLVHYYQSALTDFCCDNIIQFSKELGYTFQYVNFLKKVLRKDDDKRSQLPSYFLTEVIISKLKDEKIPILIVIQNTHQTEPPRLLYFYFDTTLKSYRFLKSITEYHRDQPCFVIEAETELSLITENDLLKMIEKIEQRRLSRVILSYMAAHPQYSGKNLFAWRENPFLRADLIGHPILSKRFKTDRKLGISTGCYLYNKSFFFIRHIFCDTYRHQSERIFADNSIYAFRGNLTCWENWPDVL